MARWLADRSRLYSRKRHLAATVWPEGALAGLAFVGLGGVLAVVLAWVPMRPRDRAMDQSGVLVSKGAAQPGEVLSSGIAVVPRPSSSSGDELPRGLETMVQGLPLRRAVKAGQLLVWQDFAQVSTTSHDWGASTAVNRQDAGKPSEAGFCEVVAVAPDGLAAGDLVDVIGHLSPAAPQGLPGFGGTMRVAANATVRWCRLRGNLETVRWARTYEAGLRLPEEDCARVRFVRQTTGWRLHLTKVPGSRRAGTPAAGEAE